MVLCKSYVMPFIWESYVRKFIHFVIGWLLKKWWTRSMFIHTVLGDDMHLNFILSFSNDKYKKIWPLSLHHLIFINMLHNKIMRYQINYTRLDITYSFLTDNQIRVLKFIMHKLSQNCYIVKHNWKFNLFHITNWN